MEAGYDIGEMHQEINKVLSDNVAGRDKAAISYVMNSPDGRWFVARLLENCHVDSALGLLRSDGSVVMDTNAMLVQEGERRVGLVIKENILSMGDGLSLYHQMEAESKAYNDQQEEIKRSIVSRYMKAEE